MTRERIEETVRLWQDQPVDFLALVSASSLRGVNERRIDRGKIGRSGRMG